MKSRIFSLTILVLLLLALASPAAAQTYAFSLDEETVHVYWQSDGTLTLAYEFVFTNATYADPIDFVDVGMPNSSYNVSLASADIDGVAISHIADSPYVTNGIELGLGGRAIQPGRSGTVHFQIDGLRNVLYEDSTDDSYASAVFSPTWFDSDFVSGSTDLSVIFHLPPGVLSDEPRYHRAPAGWPEEPVTGLDDQGRVVYIWRNPTANGHTQYLFGSSFPGNYVPAGSIAQPSIWQRLGIDPEALIGFSIFCGVFAFMFGIPIMAMVGANKRKLKYLPPKIAIEGHGIKRGLTAIEAAILLEEPMDKILTMILFATIKKQVATVTKQKPLTLEIIKPLPKKLRGYEKDFLTAMKVTAKAKRRKEMQKAMINLVRSVTRKMKGFSRRETSKYYRKIIERAWAQVEAANTPEVRSEKYDKVMEWTMLDKDYDDRTREVFRHHPVFIPHWWHRYNPSTPRPSTPRGPASRPTPGGAGLPHLPGSDFAAQVVTGVESFAAGVVGSVTDFTSGVTKTTNPPPKPSSSSSGRSSGGSSCACACACAGCACACAGGGR